MTTFLTYDETVKTVSKVMLDNHKALLDLSEYFSDVSVSFETFMENLNEINKLFERTGKAQPDESNFYKAWTELAQSQLAPLKNFEEPTKKMREEVAESLKKSAADYLKNAQIIAQRGRDIIEKLAKAEKENEDAYKKYQEAAEDLKKANEENSVDLDAHKDRFVSVQNLALNAHDKNNEVRAAASASFEGMLNDFENLEIRRIETVKGALITFAKEMQQIAQNVTENTNAISEGLSSLNYQAEVESLSIPDDLKEPRTEDRFQLIAVDPLTSKYINTASLYKTELSNGGRIMAVTEDYKGKRDELNVVKDEVVVVIQEDGSRALCHNINESEGYIPLSLLTPK